MIIWVVAGLLALATGLRIGWALVNRQSVVSAAMIVALGSLTVLAALNWPPLTALVDSALDRPNATAALSLVALVASATGSCVMITSVASRRAPAATRRRAAVQYGAGAAVAVLVVLSFLTAARRPQMPPRQYLDDALAAGAPFGWLLPLVYVLAVLSVVTWVGLRLVSPTRRGRALSVFIAGSALIVAACALLALGALAPTGWAGVGPAAALLTTAMAIVAIGVLLPTVEDWLAARRERRLIAPLLRELERRHPDVGIGERPRGPLVFQVAEDLSVISDALYLEAAVADQAAGGSGRDAGLPVRATPVEQATTIARWIHGGPDTVATGFPGSAWLRQPDGYTDREWILAIARAYRSISARPHAVAVPPDPSAGG